MKYYIANWKMNMDNESINAWFRDFKGTPQKSIIIAPSLPYLNKIKEAGFEVSAQDVSINEKGAHTGETGAFQIRNFCNYCIVGHSERHETMEEVLKKRDICLSNGITPIVCFVKVEEVEKYFKEGAIMTWEDPSNISVNGQYRPKDPAEIRTNINILKATLPSNSTLLYGGSVNRQNIKDLANILGLDGVLVGNASLDPEHFYEICRC